MLYTDIFIRVGKPPKNGTADSNGMTILNLTKNSQLIYKKIAAAHASSIRT